MKASVRILGLVIGMLVMSGLAHAGVSVQASVDRDHIQLGDSLTLTLDVSGASSGVSADLSPLQKDFNVLGRSTSVSQSWVNGRVSATSSISISLRPLHAGTLTIPALDVDGQTTRPLTVQVSDAPVRGQGKVGDPAFIEVSMNAHKVYVGQQVALDVRLLYTPALMDGNMSTPQVDGAKVSALGRAVRFQTRRGGMTYNVIERHFAIIAQHAGMLQMDPIQFSGHVMDATDPGSLFSNGKLVTARSDAPRLRVLPRPAASGKGTWLPARHLELSISGLPASGQVQVGEPVTVTLHEGATGLTAAALPVPTLPGISGADVYPDQPQDVTHHNDQWLTGSRSRSFAIVPKRTGILHIPAITLPWWNVVSNQPKTASIPAQNITVVAAGPASPANAVPATASTAPAHAGPMASGSPTDVNSKPHPATSAGHMDTKSSRWRWLALTSMGLWIVAAFALLAWCFMRRRRFRRDATPMSASTPGTRALRHAFIESARGHDLHAAAQALLHWAQSERNAIRNLGMLARQLDDAEQVSAIQELQRCMFAADEKSERIGERLEKTFSSGFAWIRKPGNDGDDTSLPPLYPSR
ncbi:BatD family protein [Oleiagrimonas sp.]|uniref:BatD family protein n=1 Tax=Oleiagrimonas sp. TaxID=2010330 RepID=UPI00261C86BC|nr:BatD family protein [Oleiagrimonas sp.]MDA3915032.1 BatD family protein [Oleiagrimonas sp.]